MDALPEGGVDDARVGEVQREVHHPGFRAAEEDVLPGRPTVLRAIDAALRVRSVRMTECADIDEVRIRRMDTDLADIARLGEAHMPPRPPAVHGFVDTVAMRDIATD